MKSWTVAEMMQEKPCYTQDRVKELWTGRESLTLRDILGLDIPASDRLWVAWRQTALTSEQRSQAVESIVSRAVRAYALTHESTRMWAEKWLSREDRSREAAREAAKAAKAEARAAWEVARAAWEVARAARAARAMRAARAARSEAARSEAARAERAARSEAVRSEAVRSEAAEEAARAMRAARATEAARSESVEEAAAWATEAELDQQIKDILATLG